MGDVEALQTKPAVGMSKLQTNLIFIIQGLHFRHKVVSWTAITSDIEYLRNQAKESIMEYTEYLPEQY